MYEGLTNVTHLIATIIFVFALIYLVLGIVRPSWAGAVSRGSVILRSVLGIFLAIGLAVGVVVYTHMQPDGPHSVNTYIKNYDWEQHRHEKDAAPPATPAQ
ncbi:MAG: hypothetical protein WC829_15840 [Hyphomicrobium sp.]|jgi:hypothetical protein